MWKGVMQESTKKKKVLLARDGWHNTSAINFNKPWQDNINACHTALKYGNCAEENVQLNFKSAV